MKKSKLYIASLMSGVILSGLSACTEDIDNYQVSGLYVPVVTDNSESSSIVINSTNLDNTALVYTFTANGEQIVTGDDSIKTTLGSGYYYVQISKSEDFSSVYSSSLIDKVVTGKNNISYTALELNVIALNMGATSGEPFDIYFRIAHSYTHASDLGENFDKAAFSDVLKFTITPLKMDLSKLYILSNNGAELSNQIPQDAANGYVVWNTLYSPSENFVYTGFFYANGGWFHYFMEDGYFNYYGFNTFGVPVKDLGQGGDDGVYNCWGPNAQGCIYSEVNLKTAGSYTQTFTALVDLNISGNATSAMTFVPKSMTWKAQITTTVDNAKIQISGNTKFFDKSDSDFATGTMAFAQSGDKVVIADQSSDFVIATAGTYDVVLDLTGPEYTLTISAGVKSALPDKITIGGVEVSPVNDDSGNNTGIYKGIYTLAQGELSIAADGNAYSADLIVESYGPYIIVNDSWDIALKTKEGTLCSSGDKIPVSVSGSVGINVNATDNTYSFIK